MKLENIRKAYELKEKYDSVLHSLNCLSTYKINWIKLQYENPDYLITKVNGDLANKLKNVIIDDYTKQLEEVEKELKELGVEIDE